jgi:hypothetical protein
VSIGIELVIDMSAMNFDMTFAKFLGFGEKQFNFNSNMYKKNSNNNLNSSLNYKHSYIKRIENLINKVKYNTR